MKVGIVTLFSDNYGNKLQNLAVQTLLERMGCEVVTLVPEIKNGIRKPFSYKDKLKKLSLSYAIRFLRSRKLNKKIAKHEQTEVAKVLIQNRKQSFREFTQKYLHVADKVLSIFNCDENWLANYDCFVCGSDQIWNPTSPVPSKLFFLGFAPKEKRVALSPSFGVTKLPDYVKSIFSQRIKEIPNLSVREEKGAKIIKELTGREVPVLADPTLCVSREEWRRIEEKPSFDTDTPYVFTYFLGNQTRKYRRYIDKYAKVNGYKVINVFDLREPEYYTVNPAEFIYLIHHAKAVFTDSFHGSVFSIIMKTPFVVFDRVGNGSGMSSRIETLLKTFSLENRKYPVAIDKISNANFSGCDDIISELTKKTEDFLAKAFSSTYAGKDALVTNSYVLAKQEDCSGCTACVEICPRKCIEMKTDDEGFYYPVIDQDKCVQCNLCRNTCPAVKSLQSDFSPIAYVGYNKDSEARKNSSSGGIFSALAQVILSKGGWVYGASFDHSFVVHHTGVKCINDIVKLRASKYVQSDVRGVFSQIKNKLQDGELVYFSGTPCQVEGLLSYLGKNYENLYTQDIVCHGVPSPKVWKAYLKVVGGKPKSVSFRDKTHGWHYFSMKIRTSNKKHLKRLDQDVYTRLFLDNVILRPSCYACHFKKEVRNADFTLADCWNGKVLGLSLKDDDKGLSMIFVNSAKGKELFNTLKDKVTLQQVEYDKALMAQSAATRSVNKTEQRTVFFESANVNGYEYTIKNWYGKNFISNTKKNLVYLKTKLKRKLKK